MLPHSETCSRSSAPSSPCQGRRAPLKAHAQAPTPLLRHSQAAPGRRRCRGRRDSSSSRRQGCERAALVRCQAAAGTAEQPAKAAAAGGEASPSSARSKQRVLVVGATGYIGKFVVRELVRRGYDVLAFARERSGIKGKASKEDTLKEFEGTTVHFGDVSSPESIAEAFRRGPVDTVVSCLASRTGGKKDSWAIDYQATANVLAAARAAGARHFVLLSAICVQKPLLEFQHAKLRLEAELQAAQGDISHSIVRPTAFFKSLAGQVGLVKGGQPYVMFGDGRLASCKPISEADLAAYMADAVEDPALRNRVLPVGGPGKAWSAREQGEFLFELVGKKPWLLPVPVGIMDAVIGVLDALSRVFPNLEDAAEFGRIGKYYATESMLLWDAERGAYDAEATPSYGRDTLEAFFRRAVQEGGLAGQELGDAAVF